MQGRKSDRVCHEEEVQYTIDKRDVKSHADEDRLREKHLKRTEEIFRQDLAKRRRAFIQAGMVGPDSCLITEPTSTALEENWVVCLG